MRWKENDLVEYLSSKSGREATVSDIFQYFCVEMTNRNLASFRSCVKYMSAIDISYRKQASYIQIICQVKS